jgi:hypothetical protein
VDGQIHKFIKLRTGTGIKKYLAAFLDFRTPTPTNAYGLVGVGGTGP